MEKGHNDYCATAETGDSVSNRLALVYLAVRRTIRQKVRPTEKDEVVESFGALEFQRFINGTLTVLASVLPVIPIVVLFVVRALPIRIGLVFIFTMILSAITTFGFQVNAERVFAITTA